MFMCNKNKYLQKPAKIHPGMAYIMHTVQILIGYGVDIHHTTENTASYESWTHCGKQHILLTSLHSVVCPSPQ